MALTPTRVGDPFTLGPFAAAFVRVAFDAAYPAGGEAFTAAMAGMRSLVAVVPVGTADTGGATSTYAVRVQVAAGNLSAQCQLYSSGGGGAYVQNDPLIEETQANQSATSTLLLVIGYA